MLKFNIRNQRLTRIDSFHPVEKSVKYLYAEFNFLTPEWEGVRKKLVSERDGTYEADIVEGKCLIPWEVLTGGEFKLCVRGIDGEKVIPTNYVTVDPGKTLNEGWPGNEPTPSPEERLQKQIGDLEKLNTENKENLVAAINEVASKTGSGGIVNESFGSVVTLADSTNRNLHGLNIYGKTTQDGTPTPESPVEMVASGANGAINVSIGLSVDDTEPQTITVSTPNGLFGVPAANISAYPGNYTDENGQQWICDEIDFARGVYIQRTKTVDMGSLNWRYSTGTNPYFYTEVSKKARSQAGALCTAYRFEPNYANWQNGDLVFNDRPIKNYQMVNFVNRAYTDAAAFKEAMSGQTLLVVLETPVETPLSAEELAAYAELHTNYPTTTVYNDAGAGLGVKYVADTKLYIDNKFTELRNAILSAGANV